MGEKVIELAPSDYKREGQKKASEIPQFVAKILRPIVFLKKGSPAIWLVLCVYLSAVFVIFLYLTQIFSRLFFSSNPLNLKYGGDQSIYGYAPQALALALITPLIITFSALVIRIIWQNARFKTKEFLRYYMPSVQLTIRAIFLILSQIFFNLIPAIATLVISYLCARKPELALLAFSLRVIAVLLGIMLLYRSTPLLLAPLVSVCAQMRAEQAITLCLNLFKGKKKLILPELSAILALVIIEIACDLPLQVLAGIALVYCLISLALKVAETLSAFEERNLQARRQNTQATPAPVIINVQNLWLNKK